MRLHPWFASYIELRRQQEVEQATLSKEQLYTQSPRIEMRNEHLRYNGCEFLCMTSASNGEDDDVKQVRDS